MTVGDPLTELEREYAPDREMPLAGYATVIAVDVGATIAGLVLASRRRRLPTGIAVGDLALGAVATYKLSRLITKSSVASPLRAPVTRFEEVSGPGELNENVRGSGLRKAVGELLTCPFCMAHWIATGYAFGLVFQPRATRLVASVLGVESGAELLHHAHARLNA